MSATHRTPAAGRRRLLTAATLTLVAVITLSGCRDGQGVRDEGPSAAALLRPADAADPASGAVRHQPAGAAEAARQASPPSGNS
ncbi:hypothetical protein ABZ619_18715 [Streptomyces sp. NPDC007851]|uniref:hypothetical protein n=1 Tax=Streptomyces sp. NPDC007851 TaxID=3155008 RepID=UPI0033D574A5